MLLAYLFVEVGHVITHPDNFPPQLLFEPNGRPLCRPMMRIEDFVLPLYSRRKADHVEISANKEGLFQPGESASSHHVDREVPANIRETVLRVVGRCVDHNLMALMNQRPGQRDALPLASAFHEQFMNYESDIHRLSGRSERQFSIL